MGIISRSMGLRINSLARQHSADDQEEVTRITKFGGKIAENQSFIDSQRSDYKYILNPGNLGVTRSIGDIETKLPQFGGKPGVVIGIPDIISFRLEDDTDFILLGSYSIFEKLNNRDLVIIVLETFIFCIENDKLFYDFLSEVVKNIMKEAIDKGVKSNMSCIFICLTNLHTQYIQKNIRCVTRTLDVIMQVEYNQFYNELKQKKFYSQTTRKYNQQQTMKKKKGFGCCGLFG
jgi:serine/threonine protein phosphatase PrpC